MARAEELVRLEREVGRVKRERDSLKDVGRTLAESRSTVSVPSASSGCLSNSDEVMRPPGLGEWVLFLEGQAR